MDSIAILAQNIGTLEGKMDVVLAAQTKQRCIQSNLYYQ